MKATMEIFEEWERKDREATKGIKEEADDYHEHPKYHHLTIEKVVHEGEETGSFEDDEEDVGAKYIVENFDIELEEELAQ